MKKEVKIPFSAYLRKKGRITISESIRDANNLKVGDLIEGVIFAVKPKEATA